MSEAYELIRQCIVPRQGDQDIRLRRAAIVIDTIPSVAKKFMSMINVNLIMRENIPGGLLSSMRYLDGVVRAFIDECNKLADEITRGC